MVRVILGIAIVFLIHKSDQSFIIEFKLLNYIRQI